MNTMPATLEGDYAVFWQALADRADADNKVTVTDQAEIEMLDELDLLGGVQDVQDAPDGNGKVVTVVHETPAIDEETERAAAVASKPTKFAKTN